MPGPTPLFELRNAVGSANSYESGEQLSHLGECRQDCFHLFSKTNLGRLLVPPTSFHPEEADNPIRPVDILSLKLGPSPYRRLLMPTLEEPAREQIDVVFIVCGWAIQDYKSSNLGATRGIAEQSGFYAENVPDFRATLSSSELHFLYV